MSKSTRKLSGLAKKRPKPTSLMDDIQSWCDDLDKKTVNLGGVKTVIYSTRGSGPVTLLVHGINGDYHGMALLATKIKGKKVLVDLPGHGKSSTPEWSDLDSLRQWFGELATFVSKTYSNGKIRRIIAHSFGCFAIKEFRSTPIIFISPVLRPKPFLNKVSSAANKLFKSKILIKIYNQTTFSAVRGFFMFRHKTKKNFRFIHWVATKDHLTTVEQRRYQAKLSDAVKQGNYWSSISPEIVIYGKYDRISKVKSVADAQSAFPSAKIVALDSGHLSPHELPDKLSEIISKA